MSKVKSHLAHYIIKEHFGDIVEKVTAYLICEGEKSLKDIVRNTTLSNEEVKKSLSILIHHNLVTTKKNDHKISQYHVELDLILKRKRYQRYVYCAKLKFGDIAELIIETLLLSGSDILSHVAKRVADRLEVDDQEDEKPDVHIVIQKCKELILGRYIKRVKVAKSLEDDKEKLNLEEEEKEMFMVPQGIGVKRKRNPHGGPSSKKSRNNTGSADQDEIYEDDGIYWHVHFDQFDQVFIDQMIIDAASERLDQSASKIVGTILKMSESSRHLASTVTTNISIFELIKKLPSIPRLEHQEVHQYLSLLSDETTGGFVSKVDEAAGGMYCVNIQKSVELICQSACSSIVQERFGSKACRVFRLLIQKLHLEQKQIGELAMIPFKEVKELLYNLFEERFLKIQEVSKASDYAPSRTFYLFGVDLPQVSRLLVSRSYQAISNLMARREAEMENNKRLLEKNEKIDGILSALSTTNEDTDQVMEELEELITPTEKQQLEKLKVDLARLEQGEIQVEDTIFILQNYLRFH